MFKRTYHAYCTIQDSKGNPQPSYYTCFTTTSFFSLTATELANVVEEHVKSETTPDSIVFIESLTRLS